MLSLAQNTSDTAFNDIKGHWAEDVINKWHENGIVSSYPDGTFKPDNHITRAEVAKIIVAAFNLQEKNELNYANSSMDVYSFSQNDSNNDWSVHS